MSKRRAPTSDEKVSALLLMLWDMQGDPIPFGIAQQLTAHQICSLVQWHHETPDVWTHNYHPTNLTPLLILVHRKRTAEIDVPKISKVRRAEKKRTNPKPKRRIQSRGFPTKQERKALREKYGDH